MAIDLNDIKGVCKREIGRAGARYTPNIEEGAPNLQVKRVLNAIDALSFNERANNKLKTLSDSLKEVWKGSRTTTKSLFKNRKQTPLYIAEILDLLRCNNPGDITNELQKLSRSLNFVIEVLREKRRELLELERKDEDSDKKSSIQSERIKIGEILDVVGRVENYHVSISGFLKNNRVLLLGQWGTGKTHTLADITQNRMKNNKPSLFILAHHLSHSGDPITQICSDFNLNCTKQELLNFLQAAGESIDERALLIIDGINEGDREVWSDTIRDIADEIADYSHIGLILSCRTPYDEYLFTVGERDSFEVVRHLGFTESEIDAQEEFFNYYDIPIPQVPLLNPEFARPLFLKLFCKAVENRAQRTKRRKIRELANGQKGMTYLFEYFTKNVGEAIENEFDLSGKTCWNIIKGVSRGNKGLQGLAVTMAKKGRRYVTHDEAIDIVLKITSLKNQNTARELIQGMAGQGLLLEDLVYDDGDYIEVIRLPYQRFSDHVIARYLLYTSGYLNKETKETIRRSFYRNRPLGKIFLTDRYGDSFSDPGLASALILEFPEAVKNTLPENERELIAYLPKKRRYFKPIAESFLDGLIWRSNATFSDQTERLIQILLDKSDDYYLEETFEALVTLGCRTEHRFNAKWLWNYLMDQSIQQRDLHWSEYICGVRNGSTLLRLLSWIEQVGISRLDQKTADNLIVLLSTVLTTTHRKRRDRVTRALYLLGYEWPESLFEHTIQSLEFNDPYVPERMLASSYGVVMNSWAKGEPSFNDSLGAFAKILYKEILAPNADHPTYHTLMIGYVTGMIELARKVKPHCIANQYVQYTRSPFEQLSSPFPPAEDINENKVEDADNAIHLDFGNYTIGGGLIPDRGNYSFDYPEYVDVRLQIQWRIKDLGYDSSLFQAIDRRLGRRNFNSGRSNNGSKIDRYGKKYSWIAYFEMYGMREDQGILPEHMGNRSSDCDIDPSFPLVEKGWEPELSDLFSGSPVEPLEWLSCDTVPDYKPFHIVDSIHGISGPWVLLGGFIEQKAKDDRRIFTFLRGLFVNFENVQVLRGRVEGTPYPGNHKIPDPQTDYYIYCGEIPWSCTYGSDLRNSKCDAKRDIREVFTERKIEIIKKHVDDLDEDELLHLNTLQQIQRLPGMGGQERELIDENGIVSLSNSREIPGIKAENPIYKFGWEGYHSQMNQLGTTHFPAPSLCEKLNLKHIGQSIDLYDKNGKKAFLYRTGKKADSHDIHMAYLRKDLLEEYLSDTGQDLVWIDWGERTLHYDVMNVINQSSEAQNIYQKHLHIHKNVISYRDIQ